MSKKMNTRIKEEIKKNPKLVPILENYDINCSTCDGNCMSKDIFEEHNLSMKEEMEIKSKISKVIP